MPKSNAVYSGNTFSRGCYFFERVLLFREGATFSRGYNFFKRVSNFQVGAYLFKRVHFYVGIRLSNWVLLFREYFFKREKGTFSRG